MPVIARTLAAAAIAAALASIGAARSAAALPSDPPEDPRATRREAREALRSGDFSAPTAAWREGPVRYLLTSEEDHAFRRLRSREERARFIARFWDSRDPDPTTPENEYRALFEARVATASRLFTAESTKPGWKTDRGKIFILLGPPDDLDEATLRRLDAYVITWTYRDPPAGTTASPNTRVRFVRDASGEYRLSTGIRLFASETAMSEALSLQAMQVTSQPEARSILDRATAGPAAAGFDARAESFRAGPGLALVLLTLWVPDDLFPAGEDGAAPPFEVAARLASTDGAGRTYDLTGERALVPGTGDLGATSGGRRLFQGGILVRPGRYDVHCVLVRHGDPMVRSFRDAIDVPDVPDAGLAVGPVRLAARLEHLPDRPGPDYVPPFVLGRLRFVPHLEPLLERGEDLAFYYQVIGAALDPIEGLPDMDVEYRILADEDGAPEPRPFGQPIRLTHEHGFVQGFALPTAGWRPGRYRIRVTVTDNLTGAIASRETEFAVR